MCGINGFTFRDEKLLETMLQLTKHRGPDDRGFYYDGNISLGHNRLSIIDLSPAGHQPMATPDGQLIITYNGELYNYQALRAELEKDYPFQSQTDTEVILAAYKKWGIECLKKFNGMFAFALWDKTKEALYLVRDQIGIKPLYYSQQGNNLFFSSEIKALKQALPGLKLNHEALNAYFRLLFVPAPATMWSGVFKLLPGHWACFQAGKLTTERYWQADSFDALSGQGAIEKQILATFTGAVESQLVSDRPLGLYLSGGIDSTAILGAMAALGQSQVKTFSVGFAIKEQSEKYNADFLLARRTSAHFGSAHSEFLIKEQDIKDVFEKTVWHGDDLVTNHTAPIMYYLGRETKKAVDVVLTGDGGDELFAGYERYYLNFMLDRLQRWPKFLRAGRLPALAFKLAGKEKLVEQLNIPPGFERYAAFMIQKEALMAQFLQPGFSNGPTTRLAMEKFLSNGPLPADSTKYLMMADLKTWLVDDALNRSDRMSMAHGLEARVPFLDINMVKLAMNIPARFSIDSRAQGKKILRQALRQYIPPFVYNEPKRGWFSPMAKWLRADLKDWAQEILSSGYNPAAAEYLNFAGIDKIFANHQTGKAYALNTLWSLITFQVWLKNNK